MIQAYIHLLDAIESDKGHECTGLDCGQNEDIDHPVVMKNRNSSSTLTNGKGIIEFIAACLDMHHHQVLHVIDVIDIVHALSKIPHAYLVQNFASTLSNAGEEHEKVFRFP